MKYHFLRFRSYKILVTVYTKPLNRSYKIDKHNGVPACRVGTRPLHALFKYNIIYTYIQRYVISVYFKWKKKFLKY